MRIKKSISLLVFILLLFFNKSILCQSISKTKSIGTWNLINFKYHYTKSLFFTVEGQLRSLKTYSHFHYHEFSQSTNYRFNTNLIGTLGIGKYDTYQEGGNFITPKNNDEVRLWPQLTTFQRYEHILIEHRYRVELRFATNNYRNRYRYRLGVQIPFGTEKNNYKPFSFQLNNELFFSENEPYFERNRIQSILNYKPTKNINIQLGYLYQFDYKIVDEIGRSFFVFGINFDFSRELDQK